MKLTVGLLLVCLGIISTVYGQTNPINCGDTLYEYISRQEKKTYTFTSPLDYTSITIDACISVVSDTEIQYDLGDGNWITAGQCPSDITKKAFVTIPSISTGQVVQIKVGSSKKRKVGGSNTGLTCSGGVTAPPTDATSAPTSKPTDETSAPSQATTAPSSATSGPTSSTSAPTSSTSAPTSSTSAPSSSTAAPTGKPSDETSAPTPKPTDATSAPTDADSSPSPSTCGRHRVAWHLQTKEQRLLYINGFKALHSAGKIDQFNHVHRYNAMHGEGGFLPWHRYFLWELETQIRALGGDYACFALPYFDWAFELTEANNVFENMIIFKSGLGDIGGGGCVTGGGVSNNEYTVSNTHFNRAQYSADGNCLIRDSCTGNNCYWTGSTVGDLMEKMENFDEFSAYRYSIENSGHNMCHMRVAGNGNSHIGSTATAAYDPIFWLLHCYVDYQWAVFQDCHQQETYSGSDVTWSMYSETDITTAMDFGILESGDSGNIDGATATRNWATPPYVLSTSNNIGVRPCDMNSWIDGLLADVTYETGAFFELDGGVYSDTDECSNKMSSNVFVDTGLYGADRRRRRRLQNGGDYDTAYGQFSAATYNALNERVGGQQRNKEQRRSVYKTWARLECEYLTMESPCVRPKYFDDCGYMEIALRDRGYQQYQDIDITKDELLEKVGDTQCMIDTIETMYSWAYETGNLLGLCRGDYYPFCDRDSLNESPESNQDEDECEARENRRRGGGKRDYSSQSNVANLVNDDFMFDKNSHKLTEMEHILISGMINGLIISSIILMMYCCYKMKHSAMTSKTHQEHKYDAVDAEYQ